MNPILHLIIISVTVFNSISLYNCSIDKNEYTIFECKQKSLHLISENDYNNKTYQSEKLSDEQIIALEKKQAIDIKYYELRNKRLKQDVKESNNERITNDTIKATEVLKAIQEGIKKIVKMSSIHSTDRNPKFFENKYGFINLPLKTKDLTFNAFSVDNFLNLRKLYNVDKDFNYSFTLDSPFVKQNTGNDKFKMFYTVDYKFVIKTITFKEQEALKYILFDFFSHFCKYPDSLLPKISGLYHIVNKSIESFIIVMPNIYSRPLQKTINERYYIRGVANKKPLKKEDKDDRVFQLSDNNFIDKYPRGFTISPMLHASVKQILENDCALLQKLRMTNYSLALITTPIDKHVFIEVKSQLIPPTKSICQQKIVKNEILVNGQPKNMSIKIEINNILNKYDIPRIIEHKVKGIILHQGDKTTIQDPQKYAQRFLNFITKSVFLPAEYY